MSITQHIAAAAAALWLAAVPAPAQEAPDETQARAALSEAGNPQIAGADPQAAIGLIAGTTGNGPCAACHGARGEGKADGNIPRLAGQGTAYLYSSLKAYASGTRPNEVMSPIAQSLSDEQMRDLAAYYALVAPQPQEPPSTAVVSARGLELARIGDQAKGIQACANCHGPEGAGLKPDLPALAGQYAPYMIDQIKLWQQATRKSDPYGVMRGIASRLDEADAKAVAEYYASIPPAARSATASASPPVFTGAAKETP